MCSIKQQPFYYGDGKAFQKEVSCLLSNNHLFGNESGMKLLTRTLISILLLGFLSACAPDVGSEKWCVKLEEKPKDEWTVKEVKDYAKHCLLR